MKQKSYLFAGIILGGIIGFSLGYLRLPFVEWNFSMLIWVIAALALTLSLVFFMSNLKTNAFLWVIGFLLLVGFIGGYFLLNQKQQLRNTITDQEQTIKQLTQNMESSQNQSLEQQMLDLLDRANQELKSSSNNLVDEETISGLITLSKSFKSYQYFSRDTLSENKFSPERGQLLLSLLDLNLDTLQMAKIMREGSFEAAVLEGADLNGANLSQAKLEGANLKNANLRKTNLKNTNLEGAILWGAKLNQSNLSGAILKEADFRWAEMNECILKDAMMLGVNLSDAKLNKARIERVDMRWSNLSGTMLSEASLEQAVITGAKLARANLKNANLQNAILALAELDEADLRGANFNGVCVKEPNWIVQLQESQAIGAERIKEEYVITEDSSAPFNLRLSRTKK